MAELRGPMLELVDPVGAYNALRSEIDIRSEAHTAEKPFS